MHRLTEAKLFLAGVALIALHVVDDNFLQPNDGTSWSDHLVSGLMPLAVLCLLAWAYPRLRGSRRAAVALPVGVFGIAGAVEAYWYASNGVASGDDYTGFASALAGVALIGLGAVTAWRTRRVSGSLPRRAARRGLAGVAGVAFGVLVMVPIALGYGFTHTARPPVSQIDLGPTAIDAKLHTSDDLELAATYVPSRNGAAVIVFPGRKTSQKHARMLMRHGYGVLIMDRRGEGESDGDPNSFGWGGTKDISAAVDYLRDRPDVSPGRIGGLGLSVGGELMIEHAARHAGLDAVVSEGAGTRQVREAVDLGERNPLGIAMHSVLTASTAVFSDTAPPERLKTLIDDIAPKPLFLIFTAKGRAGVERRENREYFSTARAPKRLWEVPTGGHIGGIDAEPRDYELKVTGFFDRALL